ncbi:hypothetical protein LCGC14_2969520 [marine sediment metagenome]|uniref:Transcriptional regulator SutA RNAP-binding domain-containing protein n=1 Tax=marine sediment metagenome TaxID=412755 RepID=A0A0F8XAT2_9ZZZZ
MLKPNIQQHFRKNISIGFVKQMPRDNVESTEQFLKRGGKITKVPRGTTGVKAVYRGTSHLRNN